MSPASLPSQRKHGVRARGRTIEEWMRELAVGYRQGEPDLPELWKREASGGGGDDEDLVRLIAADIECRTAVAREVELERYVALFPQLADRSEALCRMLERVRDDFARASTPDARAEPTLAYSPPAPSLFSAPSQTAASGDCAADSPPSSGKVLGQYRIERALGKGGFGTVYLAEDTQLHRMVAIKIKEISPGGSTGLSVDFLHEAQSIARLDHPAIVRLLHTGETEDGRGYLVYEYVAGETLYSRIQRRDYSVEEAIEWTIAVAEALDYSHRHGIVHRDVSPRNIMIDGEGRARLLDFGLSRRDGAFFLEGPEQVLGTPDFMSPEQAAGKAHWATSHSDLFSLGSVLYYAVTGTKPFAGSSPRDIMERVRSAVPAAPRSLSDAVPAPLEKICLRALSKSAEERYATGRDLANALRELAKPQWSQRGVIARSVWRNLLGLAGVCLGGAALLFAIMPGESPRPADAAPAAPTNSVAKSAALADVAYFVEEAGVRRRAHVNHLPLRRTLQMEASGDGASDHFHFIACNQYLGDAGVSDFRLEVVSGGDTTFLVENPRPGWLLVLVAVTSEAVSAEEIKKRLTPIFAQPVDVAAGEAWNSTVLIQGSAIAESKIATFRDRLEPRLPEIRRADLGRLDFARLKETLNDLFPDRQYYGRLFGVAGN